MWLVNNNKWTSCTESIERAIKPLNNASVIIATEHIILGNFQQLHIYQKDINLFGIPVRSLHKFTYGCWEILPAFLFFLGRLQSEQFDFCIISAHIPEMTFDITVLHKLSCSGLDWKRRYGNNKFIDTIPFVQLVHRPGINVCFTRTRFHLDVKIQAVCIMRICTILRLYAVPLLYGNNILTHPIF